MALEAKEIMVHIRRGLFFSIRIFYRSSHDHPFVWSFVFFLLILYKFHPSLFGFIISCSPVFVCTALLLGTLLVYGDANIPEKEEQNIEGSQNVRTGDKYVFSDDEFSVEARLACKSTYRGGGYESDHAESSSPDPSVTDIVPMLDELHPLLDADAPQLALRSAENSDASSVASQDQSDDVSIEEEIENQEDEDDEAQEKDDANEAVLKWTEDDQKNLIDLGTSELERNQRLENLMAKRIARKCLSFNGEKNLTDFNIRDPVPSMEDLSRFKFQISSISVPRRNPFDIPFEEETVGLPPIPGSAPSVLQQRQNPFDVPYDQEEETNSLNKMTVNRQEFLPLPRRDMFFHGNGNFPLDSASSGDARQGARASILKPYFGAQIKDSEVAGFTSFGRESSENVTSKINSAHDSGTSSSGVDRKDHREHVEPVARAESRLLSLAYDTSPPVAKKALSRSSAFADAGKEGSWVATSCLAYVDENESKMPVVSEIKEGDVIGGGLPGIGEDIAHPDSPVPSQFVLPSRLSFLGGHKSSSPVEEDAANSEASSKPVKPLTPREVPSVLHSEKRLSNIVDLPPIPEEN